jgi:hypothetical protein
MEHILVYVVSGLIFLGKAFSKILLAVFGVSLFLLTVPIARSAKTYVIALMGAVIIGLVLGMFESDYGWSGAKSHTVAAIAGFFLYTILHVFGKMHKMIESDEELMNAVFERLKRIIIGKKQ